MTIDPLRAPGDAPAACSARGCRAVAQWGLLWNNPRLHDPQRRKVWTACDDHRESLGQFLELRGFLRDVVPVAALTEPRDEPKADSEQAVSEPAGDRAAP